VRGMFSWHTLGPLVPIGNHLNATAYLSIFSDHVHPLMATMYPSSDGYFQQDNLLYNFITLQNIQTLFKGQFSSEVLSVRKCLTMCSFSFSLFFTTTISLINLVGFVSLLLILIA